MSLFAIARIEENSKAVAFRVYDDQTKKSQIFLKEALLNVMIKDTEITGLKLNTRCIGNESIYYYLVQSSGVYNSSGLTVINGKGEPVGEEKYVLLGITGFCEEKHYKLVDYKGDESLVDQNTFKTMVQSNQVIGAKYQNDKFVFCKICKKRMVE
jgi:Uncharacterized conserved protein